MAAYLVGAIDIHDPAGYDRYRGGALAAVEQFGGKVLSADDTPDMLEGTVPAGHLLVIRFASMERLQAFYASDIYQHVIGHRHGSSTAVFLMAMRGLGDA